ncbi:MAG: arsenate reductase ArsC [Bryobacterales bacterium]|nr:arsenate reductase ArsC [Bryobacteraceae bacterium]MDW8352918.1 arsenate reductase ArsC [Bryobacterales bacterium]
MRVLFVCFGNSCRSQMAEGYAKALGSGVWEAESAGLYPAKAVAPLTRAVMAEKGVSLEGHYPKGLEDVRTEDYDLIVNMSGFPLPEPIRTQVVVWEIPDPIGGSVEDYRRTRDEIEQRVKALLDAVALR